MFAPAKKWPFKKADYTLPHKNDVHSSMQLPSPPKLDKPPVVQSVDRHGTDAARARLAEDCWVALWAYRHAQGLCQRCAEPWSKNHTCAKKIQLHVVQEVLETFHMLYDEISGEDLQTRPSKQLFLTLSIAVVSGTPTPSMCMMGSIQHYQMNILVDSGSSHTFVSQQLADKLSGLQPVTNPLRVEVANDNMLHCTSHLPSAVWFIQGYELQADLKVLLLSSYDMILGLDWLEQFSPMKVHWKHKWMVIPYKDSSVTLFGLLPDLPEGSVVQVCSVEVSVGNSVEASIPLEIQQLVEDFAELFEVPSDLSPPRYCDHTIPLVPGAAPFSVRPYQFARHLKDEVEKQVKEMLATVLIQKSSSPFSSLVLLVKKKDNSCRFCVDYRHLNAITIKGKYPVPIIDEFLDELSNASWFTNLDLRSRFHQIRLKPGEEFKIAFQTHCGQFEFGVVPF